MANQTILDYLQDTYCFNSEGRVVEVGKDEEGKVYVILDKTIFYPQGGGQPYDIGRMSDENTRFDIKEVRFRDGIVYHFGSFEGEGFQNEEVVSLVIDEARRRLHAKIHSAGHLVDIAIHAIGYDLVSIKGFHYPEGPYVEYEGELEGDLTDIANRLENKMNELIQEGYDVETEFIDDVTELEAKCFHVPTYLPKDKQIRMVYVCGKIGEPCGGTHVKNINEIERVRIPKIKVKNGVTRVSYIVE